EVEAPAVYAAADFGPYGRERDDGVAGALAAFDVDMQWTGSPYAVEPGAVVKDDGTPFQVFTPVSRAWVRHGWAPPVSPPGRIAWEGEVGGIPIPDAPDVEAALPAAGEEAARRRWAAFSSEALDDYQAGRDRPAGDHTSRLSPYLKWGAIHPRTLLADIDLRKPGDRAFRTELCWREFYADVLWHHPESARRALQPRMASMELDTGRRADERFAAWASGRTGYPIVDAGMRQLLAEGWMHNRVRMIVASFLVKDLHLDWARGARHFLRHLVDGDLASNNHGWQWVAGTGTDAAPYYRVFNPVTQGRKFDPEGAYVRAYVAELAGLDAPAIHAPWETGATPAGYPAPIVDHPEERQEALRRYQAAREG
ncbi:MAG: cryptochrome/photolyase family protein, partial [Acidimicrobiales bacterium]